MWHEALIAIFIFCAWHSVNNKNWGLATAEALLTLALIANALH